MQASPPPFDAILLTGGAGRRLGGIDKASVLLGGRRLVARAASAVADAEALIVVGPPAAADSLHPRTVVTREDPPATGPVAALAAGMAHVTAPHVAVLACDLPFMTAEAMTGLRHALATAPEDTAAAMPVDDAGQDQPLCSVWRTDALRAALARLGDPTNAAVRRLVAAAAGPIVRLTGPHDGDRPPWFDCDTPADVARATEWEQDHRP